MGGGGGGGGGGGVPPISLPGSPGPWLYVLGKAEHRSPTVDTYSVSKGYTYWSIVHLLKGGGGQFLRKGDNIC